MTGFDTLKVAVRLQEEAGFEEHQARALVTAFAEGIGEELATKNDLEKTEAALQGQIVALKSDLEKTETALKSDLEKTETALQGQIVALKNDLEKTEATLRSDLEKMAAILRSEVRELEQRMTLRLGAMIAAAVGIIVAVDKLL